MSTSTVQGEHVKDLHGQRVVVAGGTSGIGLATARAAARAGAEVTVISRQQASVDRALADLPPGARGRAGDLTDPALAGQLFDDLGDINHLVFTAGEPLALMDLAALDLDKARQFFNLRYFGALWAVHAAVPHLDPGGSITLTSGTASRRPGPGWAVAASICGAVEGLTRALAVELAPIRVNAVRPGLVQSPLWASMAPASREQLYRDTAAAIPAGRVGEPDDIARAYLYCLIQPFATGSILTVDGGTILA
ncbi:MAG TPA: SDR family oxidoreductase [Trebonia sp.]|jgi:NAD(P)-dependent dehydrogenase (short-subunit alcohol dehydrogenase family)|nr:SDR family oxidoreductase [Trebonia sp.]